MNANPQVRRYFPSLLSYRRSELDMQRMDDILKRKGIGLFAVELKETGAWLGYIGLNYLPKIVNILLKIYLYMKLDGDLSLKYGEWYCY